MPENNASQETDAKGAVNLTDQDFSKKDEVKKAPDSPAEAPGGEPKGDKTEPQPQVKSTEEWEKEKTAWEEKLANAQVGYKGTVDKLRGDLKVARDAKRAKDVETFIKAVETGGGDVAVAKAMMERETSVLGLEESVIEKEERVKEAQVELDTASKKIIAIQIAKEYGVDNIDEILTAKDPTEMRVKALQAKVKILASGQVPADKTDKTPGSAKGVDFSSMSLREQAIHALEEMERGAKEEPKK